MLKAQLNISALALIAFLIPAIAVSFSFYFSTMGGYIEACLPMIEGCTSISRAARSGNSLYFFRILMMPAAVVIGLYWIGYYQSFAEYNNKILKSLLISGVIGALFLILYVNFLGTDGSIYRFMRRTGVIFFFAGTSLAQLLQVYFQETIKHKLNPAQLKLHQYQLLVCIVLLVICFLHIIASLMHNGANLGNISEWNFAIFSNLFFLFSYYYLRSFKK
jgi:hypothetical protein